MMYRDPKDVMMHLEDEALAEFDEIHGRPPTAKEEARIADQAFNGIGEHYAGLADRARDMAKGN